MGEVVLLAVQRSFLAAEDRPKEIDRLLWLPDLLRLQAETVKSGVPGAQTQGRPAMRDFGQRGDRVGGDRRVAGHSVGDAGAQVEPLRVERGHDQTRVDVFHRELRIDDPYAADATLRASRPAPECVCRASRREALL